MKIFASWMALLIAIAPLRADDVNRASKILTSDLATQILGSEAAGGLRNTYGDTEKGKTWVSTASYSSKAGLDPKTVTLLIRHGASAAETQMAFEQSREVLKGVPVTDVGDDAYRTETPAQLDVRKGADWLIISAGDLTQPDPALQEKAAREILAKLPP
jgi:hypothetical protein